MVGITPLGTLLFAATAVGARLPSGHNARDVVARGQNTDVQVVTAYLSTVTVFTGTGNAMAPAATVTVFDSTDSSALPNVTGLLLTNGPVNATLSPTGSAATPVTSATSSATIEILTLSTITDAPESTANAGPSIDAGQEVTLTTGPLETATSVENAAAAPTFGMGSMFAGLVLALAV
ncbi:hypothetical protein QBC39DRAFT_400906 [Podospora conica]|nr:hypothetical protein QBC39DRAFT_400906 [Schizothecium conicum]